MISSRLFSFIGMVGATFKLAEGHAACYFPRSRNIMKNIDNVHGATGRALCGAGEPGLWHVNLVGDTPAMVDAWDSPKYQTPVLDVHPGDTIDFEIFVTANHNGYFVFEYLPRNEGDESVTVDGWTRLLRDPTDDRYSPYHPDRPEYAFIPNYDCTNRMQPNTSNILLKGSNPLKYKYIMPSDAKLGQGMLRMVWQTANSCVGSPTIFDDVVLNWTKNINGVDCKITRPTLTDKCSMVGECPILNNTHEIECGPEQFRNCMDINVIEGAPIDVTSATYPDYDTFANGGGVPNPDGGNTGGGDDGNDGGNPPPTPTGDGDIFTADQIAACHDNIVATSSEWDENCKSKCSYVAGTGVEWCKSLNLLENPEQCVLAQWSYCTLATEGRAVTSDTAPLWSEEEVAHCQTVITASSEEYIGYCQSQCAFVNGDYSLHCRLKNLTESPEQCVVGEFTFCSAVGGDGAQTTEAVVTTESGTLFSQAQVDHCKEVITSATPGQEESCKGSCAYVNGDYSTWCTKFGWTESPEQCVTSFWNDCIISGGNPPEPDTTTAPAEDTTTTHTTASTTTTRPTTQGGNNPSGALTGTVEECQSSISPQQPSWSTACSNICASIGNLPEAQFCLTKNQSTYAQCTQLVFPYCFPKA